MKPKLIFWIDSGAYSHLGLAKYIHDNFECELFSIIEVPNEPKKFFQSQKLVKFTKIWFYFDYILKTKRKPDLNYLKSIEEKLSELFDELKSLQSKGQNLDKSVNSIFDKLND